jgi:hypothetical protein
MKPSSRRRKRRQLAATILMGMVGWAGYSMASPPDHSLPVQVPAGQSPQSDEASTQDSAAPIRENQFVLGPVQLANAEASMEFSDSLSGDQETSSSDEPEAAPLRRSAARLRVALSEPIDFDEPTTIHEPEEGPAEQEHFHDDSSEGSFDHPYREDGDRTPASLVDHATPPVLDATLEDDSTLEAKRAVDDEPRFEDTATLSDDPQDVANGDPMIVKSLSDEDVQSIATFGDDVETESFDDQAPAALLAVEPPLLRAAPASDSLIDETKSSTPTEALHRADEGLVVTLDGSDQPEPTIPPDPSTKPASSDPMALHSVPPRALAPYGLALHNPHVDSTSQRAAKGDNVQDPKVAASQSGSQLAIATPSGSIQFRRPAIDTASPYDRDSTNNPSADNAAHPDASELLVTLDDSERPAITPPDQEVRPFPTAVPISQSIQLSVADGKTLLLDNTVDRIEVEHLGVCKPMSTGQNRLVVVGLQPGETKVAVWFAEQSEPRVYTVQVSGEEPADDQANQLAQFAGELDAMFPGAQVTIEPLHEGLVVRGIAPSGDAATKILRLVRRTHIVPVVDQLEIQR